MKEDLRKPIRPERLRQIPRSFSWVDREVLHQRYLHTLSGDAIALYFFLVLAAGPEGTSFWSYPAMARILKLTEDQLIEATRELIRRDLVAFRYPTFQVLSLPRRSER